MSTNKKIINYILKYAKKYFFKFVDCVPHNNNFLRTG